VLVTLLISIPAVLCSCSRARGARRGAGSSALWPAPTLRGSSNGRVSEFDSEDLGSSLRS
jgi:hypothetical protein